MIWQTHTLQRPDHILHYYTAGEGTTPLIWLHGGPGETHYDLRSAAESLLDAFPCVLYDQRGSGASTLESTTPDALHIDRLIEDLEALRVHLSIDRLNLIGHSWGAMLALAYSIAYPENVMRQVLIGMGPLDKSYSAVVKSNLRAGLSRHQRYLLDVLVGQRKVARTQQDDASFRKLQQRIVAEFYADAWFYSPEAGVQYAQHYRDYYDYNPVVSEKVMPTWYELDALSLVDSLPMPTLVLYGRQDIEPIEQAYLLAERMPYVRIALLNNCGHFPWLEQPDEFYNTLASFLGITA